MKRKHLSMWNFVTSSTILLLLFLGCKIESKQNDTSDWQVYNTTADSVIHSISSKDVRLFTEVESKNYKQVFDMGKWDEKYISFIKVIVSSQIKIYIEIPSSESGDWNNEYTYIFNNSGKLKLLIRKSSFFNSGCTDGILSEKEIFAIESGQLVKKKHEVFDENNLVKDDTTNCIFNYRFEYPVYLNYYELPVFLQHEDVLK